MITGSVWVVISATEAKDRLVDLIDTGYLAEAVGFSNSLNSLIEKIKLFVQQYGGSLPIALYERIVMQLPYSVAEQVPLILKDYSESLNNKIAIGIGMTMAEASIAARYSKNSGNIELYDPELHDQSSDMMNKSTMSRRVSEGIILPTNLYDPTVPDSTQYVSQTQDYKKRPNMQEELQAEASLIEAFSQQMGLGAVQQQMQQMQAMQQQAAQQQQPPGDLLETLNGGPVEGHTPEQPEEEGEEKEGEEDKSASPEESEKASELASAVDEAEKATSDDKIAMTLDKIKSQIPQIMGLAEKDPKAFKQTMDMINKLLQVAHSREKGTKKSETRDLVEELVKAVNERGKTHGIRYPVGTRLGRFRKVLIDGKQVWRQMASGQVQDNSGNPISIKEHNKTIEAKD